MRRKASCLCGAVRINVNHESNDLGVCHCPTCRKWAGGPFFEIECGSEVTIVGSENISIYKASAWAERGFCKVCGTHLFIRSTETNEYGVPPGLFETDDSVQFMRQVFFDKKPDYYSFSNSTRNITSDYIYEHFPQARGEDT